MIQHLDEGWSITLLIPMLLWPTIVGVMLGLIFFGGLWWTVKKMPQRKQPALWFIASFVLRMGVVLVGCYWVMQGQWPRLLACLFGLIVARAVVLTWSKRDITAEELAIDNDSLQPQPQSQHHSGFVGKDTKDNSHAS